MQLVICLFSLTESHYFYLEIIQLNLQDYDTEATVLPAVRPWMWKSVSEGGCIHGSASCCEASSIQWEKELPGDSPFVLQEMVD